MNKMHLTDSTLKKIQAGILLKIYGITMLEDTENE